MSRLVPYLATAAILLLAITQLFGALGGEIDGLLLRPLQGVAIGAVAIAFCLRRRLSSWRLAARREMLVGWLLTLALFVCSTMAAAEQLQVPVPGWAVLALFLGLFASQLCSQRAFLMLAVAAGCLSLIALALRPRPLACLLWIGATAALLGSLGRLERGARPALVSERGLGPLPLVLAVISLWWLLGWFYAGMPQAGDTTPTEIMRGWSRWFGLRVERAQPSDPPPRPGRDDLAAGALVGELRGSRGATQLSFNRDVKFGDLSSDRTLLERTVARARLLRGGPGSPRGGQLAPDPGLDLPRLWAVAALPDFRAGRWEASGQFVVREADRQGWIEADQPPAAGEPVLQQLIISPVRGVGLPTLRPLARVRLPQVGVDAEGMLHRLDSAGVSVRYEAEARVLPAGQRGLRLLQLAPADPRYLAVPAEISRDRTFRSWRFQIAGRRSPGERVRGALELLAECRYTRSPNFDPRLDPTLEFMRQRRGYCQHFASALALLLRSLGVPARLVVGFAGGQWDPDGGFYRLRQRDFHCWVEIADARRGWLPLDPVSDALVGFRLPAPRRPVVSRSSASSRASLSSRASSRASSRPSSSAPRSPSSRPATSGSAATSSSSRQSARSAPASSSSRATSSSRRRPPAPRPDDAPPDDEPSGRSAFDTEWLAARDLQVSRRERLSASPADGPRASGGRGPGWRVPQLLAGVAAWPHLSRWIGALALAILGLALVGLQPWLASRRRAEARAVAAGALQPNPPPAGTPEARVVASYRRALEALTAAGLGPGGNETISEHARRLPQQLDPARALARLALRALYGAQPLTAGDAERASDLARQLGERLRQRPPSLPPA